MLLGSSRRCHDALHSTQAQDTILRCQESPNDYGVSGGLIGPQLDGSLSFGIVQTPPSGPGLNLCEDRRASNISTYCVAGDAHLYRDAS
jgi:hypothetical protein